MGTTKNFDFPTRFNFSALLHWTRKGSLTILPKVFCPNSETSHFCKSFRKIVLFKKFLRTSKSHLWQACRNHFCQKIYQVIAQSPELLKKVWIFHETLVFSIWSSGHKDVSSVKNCRKHFGKSLTRVLLKVRESKQKTDFSEKSRRKCSSGHVDCGSQLYRKSFSQIEENRVWFKIMFSFRTFPSTPRKQVWQFYPVFLLEVKAWWKSENCFIQSTFSGTCSTGDDEC